MQNATVLILDGQGGGVGKSIISALLRLGVKAELIGAGTNPYAAEVLRKAGANLSVCGDDKILAAIKRADIITGPIGVLIPNSLKGEISADVANAVAASRAIKVLVPLNRCNIIVAGVKADTLAENIEDVAHRINELLQKL